MSSCVDWSNLPQVKTADTGYMSRRLIKAQEDLSVQYDYTVRNASASVIQFVYGDDCMDPSQMEEATGHPLNFDRLLMKVKVINHLHPSVIKCSLKD